MVATSPRTTYVTTPSAVEAADRFTRRMIYLYIFLLLFEGALRKWVLPGLATPLLLIRDPLMVVIIGSYWSAGRRLWNAYTLSLLTLGILSFLVSLAFAHGNVAIAVFGFRTLFLHFPLIFIIGNVMTREDVEQIGRYIIYVLPLITLLNGLQFYSPQSAWVNRGIGGDMEGGGFSGAMGFFRASGTFSFTAGLTTFYGLAAAFVFYFVGATDRIKKRWLLIGVGCVLAAIPLSISRGYFFQFVLSAVFFVLASMRSGKSVRKLLIGLVVAPVLVLILINFEFMRTSIDVLTARFDNAALSEGGLEGTLGNRFLGSMLEAFDLQPGIPWYGAGLGLGTNVGAALYGRAGEYLVAEEEWKRLTGEMGLLLGIPTVLLRIALGAQMMFAGIRSLLQDNSLPFMLLSFGLLQVLQASSSSPTTLGFYVLTGGLIVASFNDTSPPSHAR